ncbi:MULTISPECIES: efflux RND transporter periplasmic adaptor subunit [Novosphingobium]|jgi:membrane fusion protein (multidrug efflux system)|uniref:efflux RND transporter periplasmic adaptor subunit n=1 Tax=Novosphingobium TaxID=165696 RepID=UPI0022F245AE|nr:efflux RND transporter periplasmic adaptor subunit [Novosphingobium resinovorum]GLK43696.1 MexE family multidrug efflux RND transporter periplasmic adaptor subunit [Novosphingobium resinovorum]
MKKIAPALVLILSACGGGQEQPPAGPPEVGVVTVREQSVTLSNELPARTSAYESSDVRPQVNGLIVARLFTEGDQVRAGQPLYRIDGAPYEAAAANARAALARSRAAIASSDALARRYGELVKINAISRQDYENAVTTAQQARADVAAQQALLRSAEIDLARTTIRAPISGRIGRSTYTTGALVSASQTDALTTIQRLDPIFVDIQQSSADVLRLRQQLLAGDLTSASGNVAVKLKLEDGSTYPQEGVLKFTDVTVDPTTGSQIIRAQFPNPKGLLLPGMYVRAEFAQATKANGLLVPQVAVSRDEKGNPTVLVIGAQNKLEMRPITAPRTVGDSWLVTSGLKAGDKVVVDGAQMLRPGVPVKPVAPQGQAQGQKPAAGQPAAPADKGQ